MFEQGEMCEMILMWYVDIWFNYVCAIVHSFANMYGAFDVVLYFVVIQLFWLLINLLLILSYLTSGHLSTLHYQRFQLWRRPLRTDFLFNVLRQL